MEQPRVMLAAVGSGSGKTTLTCALLQILLEQGRSVAAFKCGPDYIDPMFHQRVLGVASRNLDLYMAGEELVTELLADAGRGRDISVIEGVMGLFDGMGGICEEGSSYHLASVTKTPIILIVNAHGMGRSLLPLLAGFLQYDSQKLIQGVIFNRMNEAFYERIRPTLEQELPVTLLGCVPDRKDMVIESRHLGLKLPQELAKLQKQISTAAQLMNSTVDVQGILAIAAQAEELILHRNILSDDAESHDGYDRPGEQKNKFEPGKEAVREIRIGIAQDEAFSFYYADNLRLLQQMGARLVPFSPLYDGRLPAQLQGLLFGGGYPELYAKRLSENRPMRSAILTAIKGGMPSLAECGGFLYLHEQMIIQKQQYPMVGAIQGSCHNTGRLVRFGYVELLEKHPHFLEPDRRIRGHEFHYFDSTQNGQDCITYKAASDRRWEAAHVTENSWWGFAHLYYASNPHFVKSFLKRAEEYGKKQEKKSIGP